MQTQACFKRDTKFGYKSRRIFYELQHFPNDGGDNSFDIDSSVDMIQAYASQQKSSFSRTHEKRGYRLSQEEKVIWDKLSESAKYTIEGNEKTSHYPSNHVNFMMLSLMNS